MALVVITGGAHCGKSEVAQNLALSRSNLGAHVTVAVFGNPDGSDVEFAERIRHHRETRPAEFTTLECFGDANWTAKVPEGDLLVVDCLGTALSALMDSNRYYSSHRDHIDAVHADVPGFREIVSFLLKRPGDTIIVTNEAGSGLVPDYESGRIYRDTICKANRAIIAAADSAYLCVAGKLINLNSLPSTIEWPED